MRAIVVGCEYSGVTTLIDGLMDWGHERGLHHHLDDHFTIPDYQHLSPEDREMMVNLTPTLKERFQRMQIVYHIRVLRRYEHALLGGFHIEEEIYGPRYYYPDMAVAHKAREYEAELPGDEILAHVTASPEVIQARMEANPHEYTLIKKADIPELLDQFQQEFEASVIKRKIQIDTSDLAPDQLLQTFLDQAAPLLS